MLRPDFAKWGQDSKAVRQVGLEADDKRTRERFLALYMIGTGQGNATQWAKETDRNPRTVMDWVHLYNNQGPTALYYQHSGGRTPFLP